MRKCLLFIVLLTMTNLHSESWNKMHKFSNLSLAEMGNKLDYEFNDLATYVSKLNRNVVGISSSMADIVTSIYARDVITENINGLVSTNQQDTNDEIDRKKLSVRGTYALVGNKMGDGTGQNGDLFMDNCKIGVNVSTPTYNFEIANGNVKWQNNATSSFTYSGGILDLYPAFDGTAQRIWSGGDLLIYGQNNTSSLNFRMDNANGLLTMSPTVLKIGADILPTTDNSWNVGQAGLYWKNMYAYGIYSSSGIYVRADATNQMPIITDNYVLNQLEMRTHFNTPPLIGRMDLTSQWWPALNSNRLTFGGRINDSVMQVYAEANQVIIGDSTNPSSMTVYGATFLSTVTISGALNTTAPVSASGEIAVSTGTHLTLNGLGGGNYSVTDVATGEVRFYRKYQLYMSIKD